MQFLVSLFFKFCDTWLPIWLRPRHILDLRQRAGAWKRVRAEHLAKHPACEVCGRTTNLTVHHIFPVSIAPELELVENNLITLCETPCHFMFGHFFSYHCYNKDVRQMARNFRAKMSRRKCTKFR
ncbi:hypothetical protein EBZ80_17520 [bacterium]|nr:hypothetical protein [Betaproteobacteria bacterium]NDE16727.1 hypothetical protein [bacterium]